MSERESRLPPGIGAELREALADGIQAGLSAWLPDAQAWRTAEPRALAAHLALWAASEAAPVIDKHTRPRLADDTGRESSGVVPVRFEPPF